MWHESSSPLVLELEHRVRRRTGRSIRNLTIEMRPERVVLRGQAATYYVKQLAQQGVRDFLPQICLENSISVESALGQQPPAA
jgi:hypothetical protein